MEINLETLGLLFVSLLTLYSPLSNVGAYAGLTAHLSRADQKRVAWTVLRNVVLAMLVFVWAGDLLFEVLGVNADTLRIAGAIALFSAGLPMMMGTDQPPTASEKPSEGSWRDIVVVPMTFPMSIGGTTAAYLVTASGLASNVVDLVAISGVVLAFAAVIFATHWFSPPLAARLRPQGRVVLNRVGGIVLVAIAVDLFAGGLSSLLPGLAG